MEYSLREYVMNDLLRIDDDELKETIRVNNSFEKKLLSIYLIIRRHR